MKIKKFIYFILRVFNYLLGFGGAFLALGAVGGLEWETLNFWQFCLYELVAGAMIFATFIVYNIRENYKYYYIKKRRN